MDMVFRICEVAQQRLNKEEVISLLSTALDYLPIEAVEEIYDSLNLEGQHGENI